MDIDRHYSLRNKRKDATTNVPSNTDSYFNGIKPYGGWMELSVKSKYKVQTWQNFILAWLIFIPNLYSLTMVINELEGDQNDEKKSLLLNLAK